MERDSTSRNHKIPVSRLNYNSLLPEMSIEEAEHFRKQCIKLSDNLYECQVRERVHIGALIALFIVGLYWDAAHLTDVAYYIIKVGIDLALVVFAIGSYIKYTERRDAESAYWRTVFGPAYLGD